MTDEVNREAFSAVHGLITQFPELHDQMEWETVPGDTGLCGTTRCVAGWATWWMARQLGLLNRKRELTDGDIRERLADELGTDTSYAAIGRAVLGLTHGRALSLFRDFNRERVVHRVQSFAETGGDITAARHASYDM